MAVRTENLQVSPGPLEPGTEVQGWRIRGRLGTSRRHGTYLVESGAQPGELFVLKLARELDDERVGRELGLLMSRVSHPHVARLRTSGRWPDPATGTLYFVMDWVRGLSLDVWADNHNPSIRAVVDKLATVALTLEHLHAEGVLHRDLKPEHILVREPDGKPILIDFGVWRHVGGEQPTAPEMVLGTPHLLSPEAVAFWCQHGGKAGVHYPYKPTDDVYSLGVTAYRVLTGRWPFPRFLARRNLFEVIPLLEPHPADRLNRRLPRALGEVVQRMMAKQVRERFQSAGEAHAALVAALSFAGPEALEIPLYTPEPKEPKPAPSRAARPRARAPWTQGLGVAMALGAVTAMAGLATHSQRVDKAKQEGLRAALAEEGTECSRNAIMYMRGYQIGTLRLRPQEHAAEKGSRVIEVRDSEQVVWAMEKPWTSRVPVGTEFHGRIWVRDRLYGRFDLLVFPDGKRVPVCMEFWKSEYTAGTAGQSEGLRFVPGIALAEPSAQPGVGRVDIQDIEADVVNRWGSLKGAEAAGPSPSLLPSTTQRGQ